MRAIRWNAGADPAVHRATRRIHRGASRRRADCMTSTPSQQCADGFEQEAGAAFPGILNERPGAAPAKTQSSVDPEPAGVPPTPGPAPRDAAFSSLDVPRFVQAGWQFLPTLCTKISTGLRGTTHRSIHRPVGLPMYSLLRWLATFEPPIRQQRSRRRQSHTTTRPSPAVN